MRIEERMPCPRCGQRRVLHHSRTVYVCFQCRHSWSAETDVPRPTVPPADPLSEFSPAQRLRLITYRAAIQAGLYTDWPTA
jgi:DNA-directed RNA polymerase subunit RPC12/RpoP